MGRVEEHNHLYFNFPLVFLRSTRVRTTEQNTHGKVTNKKQKERKVKKRLGKRGRKINEM